MTVLPQKLPYRDAFNPPLPNILYPCRISDPSKLAIISHKVVKRRRLLVLRIVVLVLLSIRPIRPWSELTERIRGKGPSGGSSG
jgi:hypothetical protein